MIRRGGGALATSCCVAALGACGGQQGPPRHPVAEMSARAAAKVGVIDLVVPDPARAERLRQLYLRVAALGHEFDVARASSLLQARTIAEQRSTQAKPADPEALERVLAPPLAHGRAMFDRYVALMLEARSLLTPEEFEQLNRVR